MESEIIRAQSGLRVGDALAPAAVDVVLPVRDQAETLPWLLDRVPPGYRTIVVDGGSTDGTAAVARAWGATVVVELDQGLGAACAAGLACATAPIVAFCDADASCDTADLPVVVQPIAVGAADLVLGARRAVSRRAWPMHLRLVNRYVARRLRQATGASLSDLGPMRAARREDLLGLGVEDRRAGWPLEVVLRAGAAGWRIVELPVAFAPLTGRGRLSMSGTVRGASRVVRDMGRVLADLG
jgi:glycosyltransferase involved in cell wall biosynthesis